MGRESNDIAAKHSENKLKFGGQDGGISLTVATFFTARNCRAEKPRVTLAIISSGRG